MFYGINTSKAVKNIISRKNQKLKGKKSKIKTALIVQSGCMRGAFSAGSLIALEKMGFTEGFDVVYGSSGGAVNASYFLSGQCPYGASIYYENINNSKFISIFRPKKIVDIDYLFDEVVKKQKPLNVKKLAASKTKLFFFVTDADAGDCIKLSQSNGNFIEMLKASCSMPVYCNKSVPFEGSNYFDGAIGMSIPIEEAVKDSCTDILVLLTQPIRAKDSVGKFESFFLKLALPKLKNFIDEYFENYNSSFDICIGRKNLQKKVNIATIVPDDGFRLNRLSKNERLLKEAAIDGAKKAFELFGNDRNVSNILRY